MIVRKTLLAASAAALMSTPAWALPSRAPSNPGTAHAPSTTPVGPPSTTPNNTNNPGSANRNSHANKGDKGSSGSNDNQGSNGSNPGDKGKGKGKSSHPGQSHKVGYVARGTLVKQTLTKNADGTYSGEVEVEVMRTNHHAAADKGKTVIYKVMNVHVTFGLPDANNDGSVGLDDLAKGDRVHLNGKIAALAKKCDQSGFTAETTIRRIIFHAPASPASNKD
ncbi:MAG TPA: hypothetical protein VNY52_01105 [Solirubrobacteraceae bacterium]|jgi:hypothetical protein|nr:hypothetical protein [Solirubrobacteraceae bacterium]